jgi:hypothetical protein
VRYVRVVVNGVVSALTVVSMGGANPLTALAPAPKLIELSEEEGRVAVGDTEVIVEEWAINLTDLPVGPVITTQINAIIQVIAAQSLATFNVYVGSTTPGDTTGGTLRATCNTSLGTEELISVSGIGFANPGGACLVQLTAVGDAAGVQSNIRSVTINIG